MSEPEPIATYLELRQSAADGSEGAGLSHSSEGLVLFHVLEVAARGEPSGVVTIVHDAGEHGGRYLEAATRLSKDGWAVALPDLRGHGRSEGARGHCAGILEVLRDLDSVQDHLAYRLPDAPKLLIGQGLGAIWSAVYALERPGRLAGLVLLAPHWDPVFEVPPAPTGLKRMFSKHGPTTPGRIGIDPRARMADERAAAAWSADEHVHDTITVRAAEQAAEAARRAAQGLAGIELRTLILHAQGDPVSPAERSRELAGGQVEARIRPGAAHDLLHGPEADDVLAEVAAWLA